MSRPTSRELDEKRSRLERSILYWGQKTIDLQAEIDILYAKRDRTVEQWDKEKAEWEATFKDE